MGAEKNAEWIATHRRSAAKMLSNHEAQRIAVNIAKLLDLAKY